MSRSSELRKILREAASAPPGEGVPGFVAMQYYGLILNRTFVIFTLPEGLYGWKFCGPVSNHSPNFFHPAQEMIDDPDDGFVPETVKQLAALAGGFFLQRSEMANVDFNPNPKWGMGGIPHSGRIEIKLKSGESREYILLGQVDGNRIREAIAGEG